MIVISIAKQKDSKLDWKSVGPYFLGYKLIGTEFNGLLNVNNNGLFFTSTKPVVLEDSSYKTINTSNPSLSLLTLLPKIQNNLSAFELTVNNDDFTLVVSSARLNRSRFYYIVGNNAIYFSTDLKLLLEYSKKEFRSEIGYSILKLGDGPEYLTIVKDIFSIPVASYIELRKEDVERTMQSRNISFSEFKHYYQFHYEMDGGNLAKTTQILERQCEFYAKGKPNIFVSGGVDSSLYNFILNEYAEKPYPAYYMFFGELDTEIQFAKRSVENTKAELSVIEISSKDYIQAFQSQAKTLIQPVGEDSPLAGAHFREKAMLGPDEFLIDCTSADGCYGSKNYLGSPLYPSASRPRSLKWIQQYLANWLKTHNFKIGDRIEPADYLIDDQLISFLNMYISSFANIWLKDASYNNKKLLPCFNWYYSLLKNKEPDDWMKYTILKLVHYASKQTTAKSYDFSLYHFDVQYPFMWLDILNDQGHYSWKEKTTDDIIKYPLKKILERYIDKGFVYRKKTGLNSMFPLWALEPDNKDFLIQIVNEQNGLFEFFLSKKHKREILKGLAKGKLHQKLIFLTEIMAMQQLWLKQQRISIG